MAQRKKSAAQTGANSTQKKYRVIFGELAEKIPSDITRRVLRRRRQEIEQTGLRIEFR